MAISPSFLSEFLGNDIKWLILSGIFMLQDVLFCYSKLRRDLATEYPLKSSGWGYFSKVNTVAGGCILVCVSWWCHLYKITVRLLSLVLATKLPLTMTKRMPPETMKYVAFCPCLSLTFSFMVPENSLSVSPSYWASIFSTLSCISFPISAAEHNQVRFCFPLPFVCSIFFLFLPFFYVTYFLAAGAACEKQVGRVKGPGH